MVVGGVIRKVFGISHGAQIIFFVAFNPSGDVKIGVLDGVVEGMATVSGVVGAVKHFVEEGVEVRVPEVEVFGGFVRVHPLQRDVGFDGEFDVEGAVGLKEFREEYGAVRVRLQEDDEFMGVDVEVEVFDPHGGCGRVLVRGRCVCC